MCRLCVLSCYIDAVVVKNMCELCVVLVLICARTATCGCVMYIITIYMSCCVHGGAVWVFGSLSEHFVNTLGLLHSA